ncbi:hypothetical protein [Ornithobacterium rhinotracheale]|uniref:hypothetical protein n=1 Tax=Ornithobacterium rhinotracheale TaxID=28251 RepID=UPI001FF61A44|nr:hypothetical protein [Ornithobacterium rhinotracheale]MCK0204835.1 hypothetical protein [Ornithobacterium rhinotracheale]
MRKTIISLCFVLLAMAMRAQVGINTISPRATLEIKKSNKKGANEGLIVPILSKSELSGVGKYEKPSLLYIKDADVFVNRSQLGKVTQEGFYYYNGMQWVPLSSTNYNVEELAQELYPKIEERYFTNIYNNNGRLKIGTNSGINARTTLEVSAASGDPLMVHTSSSSLSGISLRNANYTRGADLKINQIGDFYITDEVDNQRLYISNNNGNVGINTISPSEKLEINGNIKAAAFFGTNPNSIFPDYVFEHYYTGNSELKPNYQFKSLAEVEKFIKEKGHLPHYPSAAEVRDNGYVDIAKVQITNVEKIEELYLHIIDQNKIIQQQNQRLQEQESMLKSLQVQVNELKDLINSHKE